MDKFLDFLCMMVERLGLIDWRILENLDGCDEWQDLLLGVED